MVSFVCDYCQETLKKPKLDQHAQRCRNAQFSCIDCSVSFQGVEYRQHTSCISEAEKYQGATYKAPKKGTAASAKASKNIANPIPAVSIVDQIKAKSAPAAAAPVVEDIESTSIAKKKSKGDEKNVKKAIKVIKKSIKKATQSSCSLQSLLESSFKKAQSDNADLTLDTFTTLFLQSITVTPSSLSIVPSSDE